MKKLEDSKLIKPIILGFGKFTQGFINDLFIQKKDLLNSFVHNGLKRLTNPFDKYIDKKFEDEIFLKNFIKGAKKTVVDMAEDLMTLKAPLFKINGEFNNKLIDDFVKNFRENENDEIYKAFLEQLKKSAEEMKKENKKKK